MLYDARLDFGVKRLKRETHARCHVTLALNRSKDEVKGLKSGHTLYHINHNLEPHLLAKDSSIGVKLDIASI